MTTVRQFEQILAEMKHYFGFTSDSEVKKYNCFINEMEFDAQLTQHYDSNKYEFYRKSWRWNAQQREIGNESRTTEEFLRAVYDGYFEEQSEEAI